MKLSIKVQWKKILELRYLREYYFSCNYFCLLRWIRCRANSDHISRFAVNLDHSFSTNAQFQSPFVCEREREGEQEGERDRERQTDRTDDEQRGNIQCERDEGQTGRTVRDH